MPAGTNEPFTYAEPPASGAGKHDDCPAHLSGNYKGPCWGPVSDAACERVCISESSSNVDGYCDFSLHCLCQGRCTSEATVAAASDTMIPGP